MGYSKHGLFKTWAIQNMGYSKHGLFKTWAQEKIYLATGDTVRHACRANLPVAFQRRVDRLRIPGSHVDFIAFALFPFDKAVGLCIIRKRFGLGIVGQLAI